MLIGLLVESFQNLQADPQQETVQLLRQISAQTNSYTVTGSHINSTVPFSDPTAAPFEAQASDIFVNVCWFASLILSLAAASFAILVKQWLKEYLAIEQTNPEERLRIRYFRKGGLETWKLFEIAAVLPLILQLALTLFFVGLCVFTSAVHRSIGTTCICLVGGWAAFFGFALLAPILSPRCPYKTTFLKGVLSTIRIYVLSVTEYSLAHHVSMRARLCLWTLVVSLRLLISAALIRIRQYSSTLTVGLRLPGVIQWTLQVAGNASRLARWTFTTLYHAITQNASNSSTTSVPSQGHFKQIKDVVLKHEESEICRTNEKDIMIATGIDEMVNDELLVPIELALRQTRPPLKDVVQFAMNSAERRLNVQNLRDQSLATGERNRLTRLELLDATRIPLINIVADSLHAAVKQAAWNEPIQIGDREQADLAWRFLVFLYNKWEQPITGRVLELMRSLSSRNMFAGCRYSPITGNDAYGLSKILFNIYDGLRTLDGIWATRILSVFFQCYFWKGDPQDTRISCSLLEERLGWSDVYKDVPCGSLIAVVELACTAIDVARWREDPTWTPGETDLVGFVLDAIPVIFETCADYDYDQNTIPGVHRSLLGTLSLLYGPDTLPRFLDCILARSDVLSAGKPRNLFPVVYCASFTISHLHKSQS